MTLEFHNPSVWFLALLVLLPLVWWVPMSARRRVTILYSTIQPFKSLRPHWKAHARFILAGLRTVAVAIIIVCLARPRKGNEETRVFSEGIAIQLVVDRSGSMQARDFQINGNSVDRLTAVKEVVRSFVLGEAGRQGRPDDLIGLIIFGTYADSLCPLTFDHPHLIKTLDRSEVATTNEEAATAIGDAIALGVERLRNVEAQRRFGNQRSIKNKVMILLTDGENTAGDFEPLKAAELAAAFDIKIYTIGAGTKGLAPMPQLDMFTGRTVLRQTPVNIDEETLTEIAEMTNGKYFRATDTGSLREIYREIDKLETVEIEEKRYMHYAELATTKTTIAGLSLPPLLLCVLVVLLLEAILSNTVLRRIP